MRIFKTPDNVQWEIAIHPVSLDRAKAATGIDLLDLGNTEVLGRLSADACLVAKVLAAVCAPQIERLQLTTDQFMERMAGDTLGAAMDALMEAIVDFFPYERQRNQLRRALALSREVEQAGQAEIDQKLDDPQTLEKARQLGRRLSESFTNLPESPASIPVTSPSAS
jgi:hypothetical protein